LKENYNKKILVLGVFIVVIVASILPSISGDIEKSSIQSPIETPIGYPENDEYVLAYWKFDEGQGTILGDSSNNGLNGTINGANWTTGFSGYALDFDGIDDYVSLPTYADELGINKTDDVIFSVYFNSTSTNDGIIYSLTGINNVPELRLALLSNGSFHFKMWSSICEIQVFSYEGYNDGDWHHAEIIFNGDSGNPTAKIYIDDNLECNVTNWLCGIKHDDFINAKIGSRASATTMCFDGLIDEFKIIKYELGNEQEPPIIDGPKYGEVGEELNYTFVSYDPEEDDVEYYIKWGNEDEEPWSGPYPSGQEINVSYSWLEKGKYKIEARVRDIWGFSSWSSYWIRIGNEPPTTPVKPSGPSEGDAGVEYAFSTNSTDIDNDSIYYNWSWDDGTYSLIGPYPSGEIVYGYHSWEERGTYDVTVKAFDGFVESNCSEPHSIKIFEPELQVKEIYGGLFKIKIVVENVGDGEARNVTWSINLTKVLTGGHSGGVIPSILPNEEKTITSNIIFGLGRTPIDVKIGNIFMENEGVIILFIILFSKINW